MKYANVIAEAFSKPYVVKQWFGLLERTAAKIAKNSPMKPVSSMPNKPPIARSIRVAELIVHKIETLPECIEYTAYTDLMAMLFELLERVDRNCQSAATDIEKSEFCCPN